MSVEDRSWMYNGWNDNGWATIFVKGCTTVEAILDHFRTVEGVQICDKVAGLRYLSKAEYMAQQPSWCDDTTWNAMTDEWCHPDWKKKSETNRANRCNSRYKPHKGGSNSIATICQKLSEKEGREVSPIEAWVYTHRGSNPQDPNSLNTEEAAACLERYKMKAMELNGPEFDWLQSPVDARALYACSCGRPHGKWAIFNGMVDDREAMAEVKSSRASLVVAKHQRREREERERRRHSEDSRVAKEYAQQVLEWSRSVHNYNGSMQKFMENVAKHTGMPSTTIPLPPPPPPPPPTYGISASPNPSPENAHTIGSATGEDNPDDTLSRIAQGMFGGYVNASGSAVGNYSPDLDDDLTPF